jgi:2-keto-4-pentenoate hydratase
MIRFVIPGIAGGRETRVAEEHTRSRPASNRGHLFQRLASRLWHAEREVRAARPLRDDVPELTLDDAYAIRAEIDALRMANGAIPLGRKIGLAALELQQLAGADEPFWSYIFSDGRREPGGTLNLGRYLNPRVEPEIAITLRHDLEGPEITPAAIAAAVGAIQPAYELVDTRTTVTGLDLVEVVADSGSNAGFVLGDPIDLRGFDLSRLGQVGVRVMSVNDPGLNRAGSATALMDGPLGCLTWLARHVLARGEPLRAGEIILTGTMAGAIPLRPGDTLTTQFTGLGPAPVTVSLSGS